jgi:hypothetical protein
MKETNVRLVQVASLDKKAVSFGISIEGVESSVSFRGD